MVLGQALTDGEGRVHRMAGLLDASFSFAKRKLSLGYRQARLASDHALGPKGILLRGHEFHYAAVDDANCGAPFAFISDARGGAGKAEGSRRGNVTGTFFHVIAGSR
jgi:cobyrinic acid a,c-diamide synthase